MRHGLWDRKTLIARDKRLRLWIECMSINETSWNWVLTFRIGWVYRAGQLSKSVRDSVRWSS